MGDKIDMKNAKMMGAYINSEREAVVESDDPHALVAVLFDELLKSMNIFFQNLDKKQANLESRSKHLSRSLSLIYALQKSLDFEKGGDLALNLYRLYEYSRLKIIDSSKTGAAEDLEVAIKSLEEISGAWRNVSPSKVSNMSI